MGTYRTSRAERSAELRKVTSVVLAPTAVHSVHQAANTTEAPSMRAGSMNMARATPQRLIPGRKAMSTANGSHWVAALNLP